ncbi:uncharacterized protein BX664DRAFT_329927, partial [Halteromyces radiatus]|uniref:uncharacterized protein n=1 Tax=Halteromyces radiatus TaxID=101107 RepID=UPI0022206BF0
MVQAIFKSPLVFSRKIDNSFVFSPFFSSNAHILLNAMTDSRDSIEKQTFPHPRRQQKLSFQGMMLRHERQFLTIVQALLQQQNTINQLMSMQQTQMTIITSLLQRQCQQQHCQQQHCQQQNCQQQHCQHYVTNQVRSVAEDQHIDTRHLLEQDNTTPRRPLYDTAYEEQPEVEIKSESPDLDEAVPQMDQDQTSVNEWNNDDDDEEEDNNHDDHQTDVQQHMELERFNNNDRIDNFERDFERPKETVNGNQRLQPVHGPQCDQAIRYLVGPERARLAAIQTKDLTVMVMEDMVAKFGLKYNCYWKQLDEKYRHYAQHALEEETLKVDIQLVRCKDSWLADKLLTIKWNSRHVGYRRAVIRLKSQGMLEDTEDTRPSSGHKRKLSDSSSQTSSSTTSSSRWGSSPQETIQKDDQTPALPRRTPRKERIRKELASNLTEKFTTASSSRRL